MIEEGITYKSLASFIFYKYSYYNIDRLERGPGFDVIYIKGILGCLFMILFIFFAPVLHGI